MAAGAGSQGGGDCVDRGEGPVDLQYGCFTAVVDRGTQAVTDNTA